MGYWGSEEDLAELLHQVERAVRESPAAHWRRSSVRTAARQLGQALQERYASVDPEPADPAPAPGRVPRPTTTGR